MVACLCVAMITTGNEFEIKIFCRISAEDPKTKLFSRFSVISRDKWQKIWPKLGQQGSAKGRDGKTPSRPLLIQFFVASYAARASAYRWSMAATKCPRHRWRDIFFQEFLGQL